MPARHRGRQPALGMRERDEELLLPAAGLDAASRRAPRARTRPARRRAARRPRPGSRRRRCATPARAIHDSSSWASGASPTTCRGSRRAAPGSTRRRSSVATASAELILAPVTATLMDGKALAARIRAEVAAEVAAFPRAIGLATVLVGDDPASDVYIRMKHKATLEVGIEADDLRLPEETTERELLDARRGAERRRRDRRHPRPAAAARADRRGPRHPRRRSGQGRRRLPSRQRRAAPRGHARARAGDAARRARAPRRVRRRARGRERGRDRPQRHRRQARRAAPAAPACDRDDLPLAHPRPGRGDLDAPT